MTTTISGGVISGRIALTMQCQYAAALGDAVMGGPADYQCQQFNGTLPIIGTIVMPNVRRGTGALAGTYPQPNVPGDVTVDAKGHSVHTYVAGATALTTGMSVALSATMQVVPDTGAANTQHLGIVLNNSNAAGTLVDVLVQ